VGQKLGNYLIFHSEDVERLRPGKPGRPKKADQMPAVAD
jgi:hypothetical protein